MVILFSQLSIVLLVSAVAACDIAEKSCPDATCKAQMRFNGRVIKCVCNTDLCNGNITWPLESEEPQLAYPYSRGMMIIKSLTNHCVSLDIMLEWAILFSSQEMLSMF